MVLRRALLLCCLLLAAGTEALASGFWKIQLVRSNPPRIQTLVFNLREVEIDELEIGKQVVLMARIPGQFRSLGASLLFDNVPLVTSERRSDDFVLILPLTGRSTPVELSAISKDGKLEQERVEILFAQFDSYAAAQAERSKPGLGLSPSLGFTSLSYSEEGVAPHSAVMLSGKIGYQFPIAPPVLDGAINLFGNLAPVIADRSGKVARFIGINGRVGYSVRSVKDPWKLGLMGGFYVNQMRVSDNSFGFANVSGPQFFPVLRRKFSEGRSAYGYLKFAPVAPGGRIRSLADRELALGLGGNWSTRSNFPLSLSLDVADLRLEVVGVAISCRTATLSLGTFL